MKTSILEYLEESARKYPDVYKRQMIYLERELAPMEELYKDREKSGGIL